MNEPRKTEKMQLLEFRRGSSVENMLRDYYAQGLTDEEIADRLGISRPSLYKWLKMLDANVKGRIVSFNREGEPAAV